MRREENEIGRQVLKPIGNPAITGMFTHLTIPSSLAIGSDLIIKVEFYAHNPEGSLLKPWKTFLIADVPVLGRFELDTARRYFQDVSTGIKTYNLGKILEMPAGPISIALHLFAHWDANYDWNWIEYQALLDGYSVPFTRLDSHYSWIDITGKPPEVEVEVLEVDITPAGGGYIKTSPASQEGKSTWRNGDTGTFVHGTVVKVTAYPNSGYAFDKWSDEIEGGVSYSNPAYVKPMTEHRAVKCHFKSVITPPPEEEPTPPDEEVPPEGKFPLATVVLIGGGVGLAAVLASQLGKKQTKT